MNLRFPAVFAVAALLAGVPFSLAASTTGTVASQDLGGLPLTVNLRIDVNFQKIDEDGFAVVKFGTILIKTQLAGVTLKGALGNAFDALLPAGARLQAEVVKKGSVPSVILWRGTVNINDQLVAQGVAVVDKGQ